MTVFTGKPGNGKLLSDETPVLTRNGWKTHGALVVGDEVINQDGEFVKVTHIFPKGVANMKVTFSNGEVICCHENHEWVIDYHSGNTHKQRIVTTKEIFQSAQDHSLRKPLKGGRYEHRYKLPLRQPLQGEEKALPVQPYTLGAWLGDGRNNNPDICSSKQDYAIVERIIRDGYLPSWQTVHKDTGCIYTGFKELRSGLQSLGMCHSRRRTHKHIPDEYLTASFRQRVELLAGLLDTDGYLHHVKGGYVYSTTEAALKDSFTALLSTFGLNYYVSVYQPKVSTSGIVGRHVCYSIGFAPKFPIPCVVKRKQ